MVTLFRPVSDNRPRIYGSGTTYYVSMQVCVAQVLSQALARTLWAGTGYYISYPLSSARQRQHGRLPRIYTEGGDSVLCGNAGMLSELYHSITSSFARGKRRGRWGEEYIPQASIFSVFSLSIGGCAQMSAPPRSFYRAKVP